MQTGLTAPSCLLRSIFLRLGQLYCGATEHFVSSEQLYMCLKVGELFILFVLRLEQLGNSYQER
jgi:hypothetical protein